MDGFTRSLAVIVGIDTYSAGVLPLLNAVRDVDRLAEILQRHHGYETALLRDEEASAAAINSLIARLSIGPELLSRDDRLLLYFAGPGVAFDVLDNIGPTGYLLPVDARFGDPAMPS